MKTKNGFGGERMKNANEQERLSQAEMEEEIDSCPAPWACKASCYKRRVGCQHRNNGDEA